MNQQKTALKSTGEVIYHLPWTGNGDQPWSKRWHRYLFINPNGKNDIRFIRKSRVKFQT